MLDSITKYIPRILAVLLAFSLVFAAAPMVYAEEGSCGAGLNWSFSAGTLTITGSGKMNDYEDGNFAPWYDFREDIVRLNLPNGITSIGKLAFYECKNLMSVTIPSSVTEIGESAFAFCEGMQMLSMGSGVEKIGRSAFSDCYSVAAISIPGSVKSLGAKAFYRCETITTVTVPGSVTSMGVSVFSYCSNLVSATINADITTLPEYTFYGCEKLSTVKLPDKVTEINDYSFGECNTLNTVYYNGEDLPSEQIKESVGESAPAFSENGSVSSGDTSGKTGSDIITENPDGSTDIDSTRVSESENSTVSTFTEGTITPEGEVTVSDTSINAVVKNDSGWTETTESTQDMLDTLETAGNNSDKHVEMRLYLEEGASVDGEFIETIAGKDVTVTIMTADGSVWKINGKDIDVAELSGEYSLSYILEQGTPELCEELGVSTAFVLRFLAPAQVNAEVLIHIGPSYGRQNATLFQRDKKESVRLQSVVIDGEGYAHFYLGSVSEKTEYYIAINLPGAEEEAIVPQNMMAEYGNLEYTEPIQYEITGRKSSWGMDLGQVMGILGIVMAGVIILVGGIMFIWNKARLKNGYVPDFEDDKE